MNRSYIPEKTCCICNFQTSPDPQRLKTSRSCVSVYLHSKDKPILNIDDRALFETFVCRKPHSGGMQKVLGALGIGAGIGVGAGLAAAGILASNPVGWIVAGVLAVGLLIWGIIDLFNTKPCDLMLEISKWFDYYNVAYFNSNFAILQRSYIVCENGGILVPILNEAIAIKGAKAISDNNNTEMIIGGIASFVGGVLFPFALPTKAASIIPYAGNALLGIGVINIGTNIERKVIGHFQGNDFYHNAMEPTYSLPEINDPSDITDVDDFAKVISILKDAYHTAQSGGKILNSTDAQIYRTLQELSTMTTKELQSNWKAVQFFNDLKNNKYPGLWSKYFKRIGTNRVPKVNSSNVRNALTDYKGRNAGMVNEFKMNLGKSVNNGVSIAVLIAPFFSTYYSEQASIELAICVEEDMRY